MFCVAELDVGGQRCFEIGGELGEHGDNVSQSGKLLKCCQGWLYGDGTHAREDGGNLKISNLKNRQMLPAALEFLGPAAHLLHLCDGCSSSSQMLACDRRRSDTEQLHQPCLRRLRLGRIRLQSVEPRKGGSKIRLRRELLDA